MKLKNCFLIVLLLALESYGLGMQQKASYDGRIKFVNSIYQANFDYYVTNNDTIYDGPFKIYKENSQDDTQRNLKFESAKGYFKKGVPAEDWQISRGQYTPVGNPIVVNHKHTTKVDGNEFVASGTFKNGLKEGLWTIYDWKIDNSKVIDTFLQAQLPFRENSLAGKFTVNRDSLYLEAQVDRDHFTEGKWLFYRKEPDGSKTLLKEWRFSGARLVEKVFYDDNEPTSLAVNVPGSERGTIEEMPLSENYLKIIDMKISLNDDEILTKYYSRPRVREQYFLVMEKMNKLDSTFNNFSELPYSPDIKIRLEKYTYTKEEERIFKKVSRDLNKLNEQLTTIKKDVQLSLSRLSIKEVAYHAAVLEALEVRYINVLSKLVESYSNGNLEFVDRVQFVEKLNKLDEGTLTVNYSFDGREYNQEYTIENSYDREESPLQNLYPYVNYVAAQVAEVGAGIRTYVSQVRQDQKLQQSEERLIERYDSLKAMTDSIIGPEHNDLAGFDVGEVLKSFADRSLKTYSNLEEAGKSEQLSAYLNCFDTMEKLLISLKNVPENDLLVEEAFTNTVFNPYTFTNMDEIIKEPIFEAYREVLLPQLFEAFKDMDCNSLEDQVHNFENLFEGMIDVSQASTRKEERQIRRVKDAEKAAGILNLDLRF